MKNETQKVGRSALSILLSALTAVILLLIGIYAEGYLLRARYLVVEVVGSSMEHTLSSGDIIYSEQRAEVKRGDIVIVDVSDVDDFVSIGTDIIIKRVIAVGGDSIKCAGGNVYISANGGEYEQIPEPYIEGRNTVSFEYTLEEGEIFLMGDNRESSMDCRKTGPLKKENILGIVPEWVLGHRAIIKGWEDFNSFLFGWIKR